MNKVDLLQQLGPTIVGLVLFWAGLIKTVYRPDFLSSLWHLPYLHPSLVPLIGWILPLIEILLSAGLILNLYAAKLATVILLMGFCLLAMIVMKSKLKVPCNCFGSGDRGYSGWTIAQNMGLIALISIGFGTPRQQFQYVGLNIFVGALIIITALIFISLLGNLKIIKKLRRVNGL